ncbi:MFS transporter [Poriferisphaera sp. WC338]|uniref:MFS transporter n=1 Tax=Poriferisphaera sp. WC338 TaxID=3425129 RepID=UPI003D8199A9
MNQQAAGETKTKPLWRNGSFTLMWTSTAASGFGDRMMMLAALALLGGWVGDDRVNVQASVNFFFFLPYIILSVAGGWLADHLPRKWLMLFCDEARGLLLLLGFFLIARANGIAAIPESEYWQIWGIVALVGSMAAIFNPTRNAFVPQIVTTKQLQPANAIVLSLTVIASMIGVVVGGQIINPDAVGTVRHGLFMGALFYLISGTFFAFMKPRPHITIADTQDQPRKRSFKQGITYITTHHKVLFLIILNMIIWAAAMVVYNAVISLTKPSFGLIAPDMPPQQQQQVYTYLSAAIGLGMLTGAGAVAWIRTRYESDIVLLGGLIFAGFCSVFLALSPTIAIALAMAFGVGFFGNMSIISMMSMLQTITPNYIRGRVMGVNAMLNTLTNVTVNLVIWQLPDADILVVNSLYVFGAILILCGIIGLYKKLPTGPLPHPLMNALIRICRIYSLVWFRLKWEGRENIPMQGAAIIASNHTIATDPFLIQSCSPRFITWIMLESYRFRIMEWFWKLITPIFITDNGSDSVKLRSVLARLKEGECIGIFPEGKLQRKVRRLAEFQPGIALLARKTGAPIIPTWIEGTARKQNMLLHFFTPCRATVRFGKPIHIPPQMKRDDILEFIESHMRSLATEPEDPAPEISGNLQSVT